MRLAWALALALVMAGCRNAEVTGTDAGNAGTIAGVVVDSAGRPVAGARIVLRPADFRAPLSVAGVTAPGAGTERSIESAADGSFAFAAKASDTGAFVVEAWDGPGRAVRTGFRAADGRGVDLGRLVPAGLASIEGHVKLPEGGVGDAWVALLGSDRQAYFPQGVGTYRFAGLAAGTYRIAVRGVTRARRVSEAAVPVASGDTARIDLVAGEAEADAPGAVTARLQRAGIARGTLRARIDGTGLVASADSLGEITFPRVPPGTYSLSAWGEAPARDTVRLGGIRVQAGRETGPYFLAFPIRALIVDGIANHDWLRMTLFNSAILTASGLFEVGVSTLPPDSSTPAAWSAWHPRFSDYDVVILHCNSGRGDDGKANPWPDSMRAALEAFVAAGGGLVNTQATFPGYLGWTAFDAMHGLTWKRIDPQGPSYRVGSGDSLEPIPGSDGQPSYELKPSGTGGELIAIANPGHPLNAGMPARWRHAPSALIYGLKGPAAGVTVLAYAIEPTTGDKEPEQWVTGFGKGRVFTTVLGDLLPGATEDPFRCAGYQTTFVRGTEWAATGKVTFPIPADFPGPDSVILRNNLPSP